VDGPEVKTLSPERKVGVLWLLLLGFFLVFNAAYFPIRQYQSERAPENFEAFAERLAASGQREMAARHIASGISWFHPPYAGPYQTLVATGNAAMQDHATLYQRLEAGAVDAATLDALAQGVALPAALDLEPAVALWREKNLLSPRDVAVSSLQAAALIVAGHGEIRSDGKIGEAGLAPVSIIAASGPRAVLVIDGVDYGGTARGLYAAILSSSDGRILQLGQFDLWESWDESLRMAQFLRRAPEGSIGVFAASQEASVYFDYKNLAPEVEKFGIAPEAMVNSQLRFYGLNYTFAAIGVKGSVNSTGAMNSKPGLQAWSPGEFNGHKGHPVCVAVSPENAHE
jgi:hypothetical protein